MRTPPFLTRVVLDNYKSVAACDVSLGSLAFLVGPNGAGKSNFLDALRFVSDSLRTSLDHAIRDRGGIHEVRRRSGGHPNHFGMRLEFALPGGQTGHYGFRIAARAQGAYEVQTEQCVVKEARFGAPTSHFSLRDGALTSSAEVAPPAASDRLYLVNAAGLPGFRPVFEALSRMGFYNLSPDRIRDLQSPDPGEILARDGGNLASVLARLEHNEPGTKRRIEEYLAKVAPGVAGVTSRAIGPRETLEFHQEVAGSQYPWSFLAAGMSDGTLRALGVLVAVFQAANGDLRRVPLVGIEEPEVALHPAAAGLLLDSLRAAAAFRQVLITSHSPDLLDDPDVDTNSILAVVAEGGVTRIGPLDEVGRSALKDGLYTAGELLRLNQLAPDPKAIAEAAAAQPRLFDRIDA